MPADYAELHCRSNFSFLTGASHPQELVQRAHALGYTALALTDECSLAGVVRAHAEARRVGLHLIVGAEMRLSAQESSKTSPAQEAARASERAPLQADPPQAPPRLVLLAQSRRGYGNLSHWITLARRRAAPGPGNPSTASHAARAGGEGAQRDLRRHPRAAGRPLDPHRLLRRV